MKNNDNRRTCVAEKAKGNGVRGNEYSSVVFWVCLHDLAVTNMMLYHNVSLPLHMNHFQMAFCSSLEIYCVTS